MLSLFLNPWTFIAGGLLVSTPIIIHLINRIRYRRVQWAAMEFLLKAQKRMRRRKILEQLLLLLLRCLLVFFVGVLFARYLGGCGGTSDGSKSNETRPTSHIIILDDTPSMADGWRKEEGGQTDAFTEARRLIYEKLMPAAGEATTSQTMQLIRISDVEQIYPTKTKLVDGKEVTRTPDDIREEARVNGASISAMEDYLKTLQVSTVRRSLVDALRKAKELLDQAPPSDARMIHVLSDLRSVDWSGDGAAITELIQQFKDAGITVHLIDVVNPARKPDRKSPAFNDNVSIVDLKPRNRVVSANQQTDVEIRVKNYGSTDLKDVGISFYLNGQGNIITSIQIPTLPANQERSQTVPVTFTRTGTKEKPLDRFNIITAALATPEPGGLAIDNVRHTVVEVRESIKVLVVDGRTLEAGVDLRQKAEGDSYYLRTLFLTKAQELGNIEVVNGEFGQLEKMDLRPYSTIYLMNVPTLSEAAVKNVEKFVSEGGGVGLFLGPNVKPEDYNNRMYRGSQGFFPVPLQPEPKIMTLEQFLLRGAAFTKRLLLRSPSNKFHPALRRIYLDDRGDVLKNDGVEPFFNVVNIDAHWQVSRFGAWRDDKAVQELYCLQNEAPIGDFEGKVANLVDAIKKEYNEAKFEQARKYLDSIGGRKGLLERLRLVTSPADPKPVSELARLMDELLCDQVNTGDESEPILRDFWNQPELADVKQTLAKPLRDEAKYGDPLYVVKQFGRGRVAVMTTDAGGTYTGKKQWNDWPSLKGSPGWVVIVGEMQKYLSGGGEDTNRSVGDRFFAEFDVNRYEPTVNVQFMTVDASKPSADRKVPVIGPKDMGKITMDAPANPPGTPPDAGPRPFQLTFNDSRQIGAYLFTLTRKKEVGVPGAGDPAGKPDPLGDRDFVGVAFNVDSMSEGDLRRANTDDLSALTNKTPLHNTDDLSWLDAFKQKPSDMSSRRWLYLLILLILIAEQAWAVRISYHSKPEDLEAFSPSAAAVFAHHSTPLPSSNGEAAAPETSETPSAERV